MSSLVSVIGLPEPGGMPVPMPGWTGQDLGLPVRNQVTTDSEGMLLVELTTPGPLIQGLGVTAQEYLRTLMLTTNERHRSFASVAAGEPTLPASPYPGNGGGLCGPYLKLLQDCRSIDPNAHHTPATCDHPQAGCVCTLTSVDMGSPPVPTDICDCGAPTGPRKDGVQAPTLRNWVPPANPGEPHVGIWGRPGDTAQTFQYFDWTGSQLAQRPYLEVRHTDGTVVKYERFAVLDGRSHFRAVEIIDPRDNRVVLHYDGSQRLQWIRYPNGVDEEWDYTPSWVAGSNAHSGIEVRYHLPGTGVDPALTWGMVFEKHPATGSRPFGGDRLWRLFYPKTRAIPDSALDGSPYPSLTESEAHRVLEFSYLQLDVGIDALGAIAHHRAAAITAGDLLTGDPTGGQKTLIVTYELQVGRWRVKTMTPGQFLQETTTFGYCGDAQTGKLTSTWQLDPRGTRTTRQLDAQGRPWRMTVEPADNATGRPRAHDAANAGLTYAVGEPISKQWDFEYAGCSGCPRPSKVTESSPGGPSREVRYEYWPDSGLLKAVILPNPSNLPGQPATVTHQFTYQQGPIANGGWSAWYPDSVSGPDGTWEILVDAQDWEARLSPPTTEAPSYGLKPRVIRRRSPWVTLSQGGPVQLEESVTLDVSVPPMTTTPYRQTALVGQVKQRVDLDGVVTAFGHDGRGFLSEVIQNPNGAPAERIRTEVQIDVWGRVAQVVHQAGSALASIYQFTSTVWGHPVAASTTVGSVTLEERILLDRWGHVAVRLRTNRTATGAAPDDFGLGTANRTDMARAFLRDEYHWRGHRLQYTLEDRRELDRNESGPAANAPDARFLQTVFQWLPGELVADVGHPNGGSTRLTWDGYGTLYRQEGYHPGQPDVLHGKRFVDSFLQVVAEFQGDAQLQLWTRFTRNAAGAVTQVIEPVASSPGSWYAGSLGGAVREFDLDAMGRIVSAQVLEGTNLLARTDVAYDQLGRTRRVEQHVLGAGSGLRTWTTLWEGLSRRKRVTDDLGRFHESTFDALSRRLSTRNSLQPLADEEHYLYRAGTHLVQQVERRVVEEDGTPAHVAYRTEYEHDPLGRVTAIREFGTGSTPRVHALSYYTAGFTESYTDPAGKVHRYLPDARGRLVEHFLPGSQPIWNGTIHRDFLGTQGRTQLEQIDGRGRRTYTNHDFAGRVVSILEPGASTEPTPQSPHQPFARLLAYDAASRLTDVYAGDSVHVRYFHDGPGRLIGRETPSAGVNGFVSWYHGRDVYQRDAIGRIVGSNSYYGPAAASMPLIVEEAFLRDSLGRKHRESFRYGFGGSNWIDLVSTFTGTDWFRSGLSYQNNLGSGVDDLSMSYTPDAVGRLSELKWQTSAGGSMSLLAKYWHQGSAISRRDTYHAAGSAWKTDYAYDTYGRMSRIEHRFGAQAPFSEFDFQYDLGSNLEKEWYGKQGGGVGDRFAYDEHHRLLKGWLGADTTKMQAGDPEAQGSGSFVTKLTYGLDAANNRGSVQTEWGGGGSSTETYTTQDQGHPQGESNRYATVAGVAMDYDQRGNTIFDGNFWYVYDDQNRLTEVYLVQDSEAAMASPGLSTTTWSRGARYAVEDRAAVVAARRSILGRLPGGPADAIRRHGIPEVRRSLQEPLPRTSVSRLQASSTQSLTGGDATLQLVALYLYDGFDRRVARAVIGVQTWFYAYDDWEEAQEMVLATQTVPDKQFVWGEQLDELVAYRRKVSGSWQSQFVAEGGAHCPARVLGADGLVKEVQEYDPYGQTTLYPSGGGSNLVSLYGNPFHWKGHRFDPETGLVYMRHRYYHAGWGRFLTQDPLGVWFDGLQLGNGYAYGASNPTSMGDPLGLQAQTVPIVLGGQEDPTKDLLLTDRDRDIRNFLVERGETTLVAWGDLMARHAYGAYEELLPDRALGPCTTISIATAVDLAEMWLPGVSTVQLIWEGEIGWAMASLAGDAAVAIGLVWIKGVVASARAARVAAKAGSKAGKDVSEELLPDVSEAVRSAATGSSSRGGRGANRLRSDPHAEGPHTTFRRNPETGRIENYQTFDPEGLAGGNRRFRGTGRPHGGVEPPLVLEPRPGHPGGSPSRVRPARPEELPRGFQNEQQ